MHLAITDNGDLDGLQCGLLWYDHLACPERDSVNQCFDFLITELESNKFIGDWCLASRTRTAVRSRWKSGSICYWRYGWVDRCVVLGLQFHRLVHRIIGRAVGLWQWILECMEGSACSVPHRCSKHRDEKSNGGGVSSLQMCSPSVVPECSALYPSGNDQ